MAQWNGRECKTGRAGAVRGIRHRRAGRLRDDSLEIAQAVGGAAGDEDAGQAAALCQAPDRATRAGQERCGGLLVDDQGTVDALGVQTEHAVADRGWDRLIRWNVHAFV